MNAEVTKAFKFEEKEFKTGDTVEVIDGEVFDNGEWICDVDSPYFGWHFKLIEE